MVVFNQAEELDDWSNPIRPIPIFIKYCTTPLPKAALLLNPLLSLANIRTRAWSRGFFFNFFSSLTGSLVHIQVHWAKERLKRGVIAVIAALLL